MRPVKDVLKEFIPHITIFLIAGMISYQFIPKKAPEVEQAQLSSDTLRLYQEYARLQKFRDDAWDVYYTEHFKLQDIRDGLKSAVDKRPDDLEVLRKWVGVLKRIINTRRKYTEVRVSTDEKMDETLKQLEKLGEPPPG